MLRIVKDIHFTDKYSDLGLISGKSEQQNQTRMGHYKVTRY